MTVFKRRSIRLSEYDYASPGAYFVTLVSWNLKSIFGEVAAEEMIVNDLGILVQNEWQRLAARFPGVRLDVFVVMPNHLHGIIWIMDTDVRARQEEESTPGESSLASPLPDRTLPHPIGPSSGSLGSVVGAFKSTTTRLINGLRHTPGAQVWQRNYYEHVIRNESEWQKICAYIEANPARWQLEDEFFFAAPLPGEETGRRRRR